MPLPFRYWILAATVSLHLVHGLAAEPPEPKGKRLSEEDEVWVNVEEGTVVVGGRVTLREGPLEMFACPVNTKEYESVVALNSRAFVVHTALLAVGAIPGKPVRFHPEYVPASGSAIDVQVQWTDAEGKSHQADARQWVRDAGTGKALEQRWVFGGSGFWKDEETQEEVYFAEGGELICVSNFTTAMMDLPIESSQVNDNRLFEAFTENVPLPKTPIRLVLKPVKRVDATTQDNP